MTSSTDHQAVLLDRLASEAAIREVLARYCRGVDRCDAETIRSVYHDDAIDDHGEAAFVGLGRDFADFIVDLHLTDGSLVTQHVIASPHIAIAPDDADVADVETYYVGYRLRDEGGRRLLNTVGGRYLDRFERRDGEWRIGHRTWVRDWGTIAPVEREFPSEGFHLGSRGPDDPVYRRPLRATT